LWSLRLFRSSSVDLCWFAILLGLLKFLVHLSNSSFVSNLGFGHFRCSLSSGRFLSRLRDLLLSRGCGSGGCFSRSGLLIHNLLLLIDQVPEDIIENIVAVGLLGEDESLHKLPGRLGFVGNFTNDGNQDVVKRCLRINVQDTNFTVLEVKLLEFLVDCLSEWVVKSAMLLGRN
jgi:hypothetical protein